VYRFTPESLTLSTPRLANEFPEPSPVPDDRLCRALNLVVALVGLIIAAPLMLLIAILVKLSSPGPVFFTQPRVGLDSRRNRPWNTNHRRQIDHGGRLFHIYKFRTMRAQATAEQVWAAPDDPRVTAVGRVLRRYRLDELPQLINVLRGEMNVVGPRPEQPAIFRDLREKIELYPRRQRVLPGITGWAQVNQHYDRSIEDVERKLDYDLEYVARRSWREDLRIMARTIPVVIFRRGGW
jgi:lipopolysaccharide/colanic/teichoic acid biosynthesis glycosyltransferase